MSSSVIVARPRMWRTMVAIIRGGNLCGAAWQRLQLARNRCSPCTRMASALVPLRTTGVLTLVLSLSPLRGGLAAYADHTSANPAVRIATLVFMVAPLFPEEGQNGMPARRSRGSHFHRN